MVPKETHSSKINATQELRISQKLTQTMYIGDPHKVAAIISPGRNLANPKSA